MEYSELMGWDIQLYMDYQVGEVAYEMMFGYPGWWGGGGMQRFDEVGYKMMCGFAGG